MKDIRGIEQKEKRRGGARRTEEEERGRRESKKKGRERRSGLTPTWEGRGKGEGTVGCLFKVNVSWHSVSLVTSV